LDRAVSSSLAVPAGASAPSGDGLPQAAAAQPEAVRTSVPAPAPRRRRLDAVDWLRGLAVLLMIQTHLYDSWCNKAAKATEFYAWTRFIGGIP